MFAAEILDGLQLLKEVGVNDGLIAELIHDGSLEAGKTNTAMNEELIRIFAEQGYCSVGESVPGQEDLEGTQALGERHSIGGTCRNPSFGDASTDRSREGVLINVIQCSFPARGKFPTEFLGIAKADALIEHLPGHRFGRILYLVVRTAVIGVWRRVADRGREPDGDDLLSGTSGYVDVLGVEVDGRSELGYFVRDVLPGLVGDILPENLQCCGMYAEKEPAALSIKEGTTGLHSGIQFSGRLLDLQDAAFVAADDGLYVVYGQLLHSALFSFTNVRKEIRAAIDIHEEES